MASNARGGNPGAGSRSARRLAEGQVIVPIRVRLDRLTIGFTGGVMLMPKGQEPPLPEPTPQRPGSADADADEDSD